MGKKCNFYYALFLKGWIVNFLFLTISFFSCSDCLEAQCTGNILNNGSFTGSKGGNNTAPGWFPVSGSPDINDPSGPPQTTPGYSWTGTPLASADGGTWQNLCSTLESIGQALTVIPNQSYTLQFQYAAQGIVTGGGAYTYTAPVGVNVYLDNALVYTTPDDSTLFTWENACFTFSSAGPNISLELSPSKDVSIRTYLAIDGACLIPTGISVPINLGNDTILCPEKTLTLDAGVPNATYLWQDNSTNITYTVTQPGSYWVEATKNCIVTTDTINVTYSPLTAVHFGNDTTLCEGETLTLNATDANASYLWQDNSTNPIYTVTQQGNYWVEATLNACTVSDTININYNPLPIVNLGNDTTLCPAETLLMDVTTPGASYLWQDSSANAVFTVTQGGTYWVKAIANNCNAADTVTVLYKPLPLVEKSDPLCNLSDDGHIKITLMMNQAINSVAWTPIVSTSLLNDSTIEALHLISGIYSCDFTSNFGCTYDTAITLISPPLLLDSIKGVGVKCPNDTTGTAAVFVYGGVSPYSYSWDSSPVQTTANAGSLVFGKYIVTVTDSNACVKKDSVFISSNPFPAAGFMAPSVCFGDSIHFLNTSNLTSGSFSSSWLFGNNGDSVNSNSAAYFYPQCNTYTVKLTVTSDSGCVDVISHPVNVFCKPIAAFTATDTIGCEPVCASFHNSPLVPPGVNVQWTWDLGDGSVSHSQNFDHCYANDSVFSPIVYDVTLTVISDSGCTSSVTKNNYVTVYPNPNADFTVDAETQLITNPVISFTDLSTGATLLNWSFGDLSTSSQFSPQPHMYADTGAYIIKLVTSTSYGCIDSTYKSVTIEPDFVFYIPNGFSPNGDGINETFTGKGVFIKNFEMNVFDRWGNLIYHSTDIDKPWDGSVALSVGQAESGVYVYTINIINFKNQKHSYKGVVTLAK